MSTALILIDIQKDYFPGGRMELDGSIEAAGAAARLLAAFRKASWPVFHIQHISTQPAATFFVPGTVGLDIHPSVEPLPDEPIVIKHYPNSFRETDLLERIRSAEVNSILFCGMMTSMCVDAIARHFDERNIFYKENPKKAGNKIWDKQKFDFDKLAGGLFKKM